MTKIIHVWLLLSIFNKDTPANQSTNQRQNTRRLGWLVHQQKH